MSIDITAKNHVIVVGRNTFYIYILNYLTSQSINQIILSLFLNLGY